MNRDGLREMVGSEEVEKNERGVDKALCAKRKSSVSPKPLMFGLFSPLLQLIFCLFVPVLKVVLKTSVVK